MGARGVGKALNWVCCLVMGVFGCVGARGVQDLTVYVVPAEYVVDKLRSWAVPRRVARPLCILDCCCVLPGMVLRIVKADPAFVEEFSLQSEPLDEDLLFYHWFWASVRNRNVLKGGWLTTGRDVNTLRQKHLLLDGQKIRLVFRDGCDLARELLSLGYIVDLSPKPVSLKVMCESSLLKAQANWGCPNLPPLLQAHHTLVCLVEGMSHAERERLPARIAIIRKKRRVDVVLLVPLERDVLGWLLAGWFDGCTVVIPDVTGDVTSQLLHKAIRRLFGCQKVKLACGRPLEIWEVVPGFVTPDEAER